VRLCTLIVGASGRWTAVDTRKSCTMGGREPRSMMCGLVPLSREESIHQPLNLFSKRHAVVWRLRQGRKRTERLQLSAKSQKNKSVSTLENERKGVCMHEQDRACLLSPRTDTPSRACCLSSSRSRHSTPTSATRSQTTLIAKPPRSQPGWQQSALRRRASQAHTPSPPLLADRAPLRSAIALSVRIRVRLF
jgi:hypothetical protein